MANLHRRSSALLRHGGLLAIGTVLCAPATAQVQVRPPRPDLGIFSTFNLVNTQFPFYADNALGFEIGAFYQQQPWIGAELRVGLVPLYARFGQYPATAGFRVGTKPLGPWALASFGYVGGGASRVGDNAGKYRGTLPASWFPCIQTNIGVDRSFRHVSWRIVDISWRETYATANTLRSLSIGTGLSYHSSAVSGHPSKSKR